MNLRLEAPQDIARCKLQTLYFQSKGSDTKFTFCHSVSSDSMKLILLKNSKPEDSPNRLEILISKNIVPGF